MRKSREARGGAAPTLCPRPALSYLRHSSAFCSLMHHYPPADFEPAITDLAKFLWPDGGHEEGHSRLRMGNVRD
jgi:hypothetical protein